MSGCTYVCCATKALHFGQLSVLPLNIYDGTVKAAHTRDLASC